MVIADEVSRHVELPRFGGLGGGPGMFALCEPDETVALLGAAGFEQVDCESYTPTILVGGGGGVDESIDFLLAGGMPRGLLGLVDPEPREDVVRAVRAELVDRYEDGVGLRLGAAVWIVTAQT
jgi:hypothetical protein